MPLLALLVACASKCDDTGSCPHTCDDYCGTYLANCTGDLDAFAGSESDCKSECGTWYQGEVGALSGDTLECRYDHAIRAGDDPETHCPFAGPSGAGVCVDE